MLLNLKLRQLLKNELNTHKFLQHLERMSAENFKFLLDVLLTKIDVPELAQEILNDVLEMSSDHGHLEKVKHAIQLGANTITESIAAAAMEGRLNVLEFLVTQKHTKTDLPIIWAANGGHKDVIDFLILRGFPVSESCALYAAAHGHKMLSKYLKDLKDVEVTPDYYFFNHSSSDDLNSVSNHGV